MFTCMHKSCKYTCTNTHACRIHTPSTHAQNPVCAYAYMYTLYICTYAMHIDIYARRTHKYIPVYTQAYMYTLNTHMHIHSTPYMYICTYTYLNYTYRCTHPSVHTHILCNTYAHTAHYTHINVAQSACTQHSLHAHTHTHGHNISGIHSHIPCISHIFTTQLCIAVVHTGQEQHTTGS